MRNKGFSLVELIIAIALLGTIMAVVMTLFVVGIKNYRRESQRNFMQKEINFTADDLGTQIKQATLVPVAYDGTSRSAQTLILALPAVDEDENFIYNGDSLLYDYYIYYLSGKELYKKVVPDSQSVREEKEEPILGDVSKFECIYEPQTDTELVTCTVETTKEVSGSTLIFSATKTARLRNFR